MHFVFKGLIILLDGSINIFKKTRKDARWEGPSRRAVSECAWYGAVFDRIRDGCLEDTFIACASL
jgi:hypothetical protein